MKRIFFITSCLILSANMYADDLTATITNAAYGENDGAITLEISAGVAPFTFAWTGPGGFTAADQDITGLAPGEYCVVVNDFACGVAQLCVTVEEEPFVTILNPNITNITVYPNPFTSGLDIAISALESGNYTITLLDIDGRKVWEDIPSLQAGENTIHLNTSNILTAGIYDLVIKNENSGVVVKRVVRVE